MQQVPNNCNEKWSVSIVVLDEAQLANLNGVAKVVQA